MGILRVVAGPIGNLGDISPRAQSALSDAEAVFVEDTRISAKLLSSMDLKVPFLILNEHTNPAKIREYAERVVEAEGDFALLTDAGTPGISDPGALLSDDIWNLGGRVEPIPGASAVTTALSACGFFAQRFAFLGFLPRKPGAIREILEPFADSTMTLVFFESPHRFLKTLSACHEVLGDRRVAICRELTKLHEQIWRGSLNSLPSEKVVPAKGEFTIVVEGSRRRAND